LQIVDFADCSNIQESGLEVLLKNNSENLRELQLSNLPQAVTDKIMMHISGLDHLRFLDVSFAH